MNARSGTTPYSLPCGALNDPGQRRHRQREWMLAVRKARDAETDHLG